MLPSFLLASESPRRVALLSDAGFHFKSVTREVVERSDPDLTLSELTKWNALRKGLSVARACPDKVVLAADTLVGLKGQVIGKPRDLTEAREILKMLSGKEHEVCTAVFVGHLATRRTETWHEISRVRFKQISESEIDQYMATVNPLDKAGAYAAQGSGAAIIAKIEGSRSNVIGLPMERTIPALARFGVRSLLPNESQSTQAPPRA